MPDAKKPPTSIGIILDGNRRWAKENGLPAFEGHRRGAARLTDAARWMRDRKIQHCAAYVFSTENWNRAADEVSYLMQLFQELAEEHCAQLAKEGARIRFAGERDRLDADLARLMRRVEDESAHNDAITLWVCLSYGGRAEIAAAARAASAEGVLSEETISKNLWTAGMPDPDILIRTGGEKRLSNFLTWQSVYSELFFIDAHWPDFSEAILDSILTEYEKRERRMGR